MKFTKFGKALLMSALSAGVVLSVTSCNQSYTVAYLYVTGTVTAQSSGEGIITGIQIDHNTGKMSAVRGTPVSSGGANPVRAVLLQTSRFLYVLNRGATASGSAECTTADPCKNSNITLFTVGGNGVLTAQQTFFTQGINPFRMIADSSGGHLYVLDHDAPDSAAYSGVTPTPANPNSCMLALGNSATSCGDITAFSVNQNTGRLQLIVNAPVTAANGSALLYFPVPANPVDFAQAAASVLTLSGTPATSYPYTGGASVFPYSYNAANGQLTINQNSSQPLGIAQGTAIVYTSGVVYVLDNEPITVNFNGGVTTSSSQILPFTVGTNGALAAEPGGIIPDDPTLSNPIYLLVESKGKFVYVANQGNNTQGANAQSGLAGYFITTSPAYQLSFIPDEPFGSGAGPQCLVEDPSDQFIYSADFNDSSISGRVVDPNSGVLNNLRVTNTYALQGPATWCLVDGRTN